MSWMYQLIKDEGKIKLCELYNIDGPMFYLPISWFKLLISFNSIVSDLKYQRKHMGIIPDGEYINEMIEEMYLK